MSANNNTSETSSVSCSVSSNNIAENIDVADVDKEVNAAFDESSLVKGDTPELALILGGVAVGKTRFRRKRYGRGYVSVDAGDIFIKLSRDANFDFPSHLEKPMEVIGSSIACRAVRERRNIVVELIGAEFEPVDRLIDTYKCLGYRVNVNYLRADLEQSWERNINRSENNISAYYAEPYNRRWLMAAAAKCAG
ncbi:MAG: zeta toxin family protein [Pyrinomonadaceae bacterium]